MTEIMALSDLRAKVLNEGFIGSQIIQKIEVTLKTTPAIRFVANNYQDVRDSFRIIFVRSHKSIRAGTPGVDEFNTLISGYRKELKNNLKNITSMVAASCDKFENELAEDFDININEIEYTNPVKLSVEPKCPEERQFWEMIMAFDQMMALLDQLWHLGEAEIERKNETTSNLVKSLNGLVRSSLKKSANISRALSMYAANGSLERTLNRNEPDAQSATEKTDDEAA